MRDGHGIHSRNIPGTYRPVQNRDNDYLMDRAAQKAGTRYSGIEGIAMQDASLQESMGPVQDRTREHLGPTDAGIVEFRKMLLANARALQGGLPPPAAAAARGYAVRAGGWIAPPHDDLAAVMEQRFGPGRGYVGDDYGL